MHPAAASAPPALCALPTLAETGSFHPWAFRPAFPAAAWSHSWQSLQRGRASPYPAHSAPTPDTSSPCMHPRPPAPADSPFSNPRMRQWPSTVRRRPCPLHSAYSPHRSQTALQIRPAAAPARPARAAPCRFHPQPWCSAALIPAAPAPGRCGSAAAECATGSPAHRRPHWRGAACPCKYPAPCAPCRGAWIPPLRSPPPRA